MRVCYSVFDWENGATLVQHSCNIYVRLVALERFFMFVWETGSTSFALSAYFLARGPEARAALSAKLQWRIIAKMADIAKNKIQQIEQILCFLSSSESSDEEDEIVAMCGGGEEVPKIQNFIEEVVHNLSDKEFQSHFRCNRQTAYWIIDKFEASKFLPKDLSHGGKKPINAEKHILSFLWFTANKSSMRDVAQRFAISSSTLDQIIDRVMSFLLDDVGPSTIRMPTTQEEKDCIASEFKKISGFPNILGCIDGTSIPIRTPAHKIKSTYTNRHDMPSITLQGICDNNRRFIDVFTGVPGKIHDARVFKLSDIATRLPEICGNRYHLLGDNAYPIRTFLLTPYKDYENLTNNQKNFNTKLSSCRVRIENSFGILKSRFRQLQHLDMHSVLKITKFILSCCILHNLCIDKEDFFEDDFEASNEQLFNDVRPEPDMDIYLKRQGEQKRDIIKESLQYL